MPNNINLRVVQLIGKIYHLINKIKKDYLIFKNIKQSLEQVIEKIYQQESNIKKEELVIKKIHYLEKNMEKVLKIKENMGMFKKREN